MEVPERKKSLIFPLKGLKPRGASRLWTLRSNTVNHQLPAQQQMGVPGIGNDKSCRQRLVNPFTYLQPHSHTIQRSWLGAAQSCPGCQPLLLALLRALQEWEPRLVVQTHGTKPRDFISVSQFPSAFHPTGHIGQGRFPCSYLRETSVSPWLVLF